MDTAQHASTSTVPHVSARGVDDLLGYVGHVLGRLPRSSVCLITLQGRTLRAVARVDVPVPAPRDDRGRALWAEAVARAVRADAAADVPFTSGLAPFLPAAATGPAPTAFTPDAAAADEATFVSMRSVHALKSRVSFVLREILK